MIGALAHFARRAFRDRYPGPWAYLGEMVAALAGLAIYWYTAKAFAPIATGGVGRDYFSYLVIGEAALYLPLSLLHGLAPAIRAAAADGTLEALLVMPLRPQTPAILLQLSAALREAARVVVFLVIASALGLRAPAAGVAGALLVQLAGLPAFAGLGLLAAALLVRFGRGDAAVAYVGTVAELLAGAYFPTSALPESVHAVTAAVSPFSVLLEGTRALLAGSGHVWPAAGTLLAWGAVLLPAGYLALGGAFAWVRRAGTSLLFTA